MAEPRVSVVISTFNRAGYLSEAVESVLGQTFGDLEVIVVDDGSSDDTAQVCAGFGPRVRYLWQENAGRSVARNRGVALARGELVAFLDDDDVWLPHKLERQVAYLDAHPGVGLVHGFTEIIDPEGRPWPAETARRLEYHRQGVAASYTFEGVARFCILFISTVLVRRRFLDREPLFDPEIHGTEDWDLYLYLARRCAFATLQEPLALYRIHGANTHNEQHVRARIQTAAKHLRALESEAVPGSARVRASLYTHLSTAYYIAGDRRACRRNAARAVKADPGVLFRSRVAAHFMATLLPRGVLRGLRRPDR